MSDFTYAQAEVIARRYLRSFDLTAKVDGVEFEAALVKVMAALDLIERCFGHITFDPPLSPAPDSVYGEEKRQNWLTGWDAIEKRRTWLDVK